MRPRRPASSVDCRFQNGPAARDGPEAGTAGRRRRQDQHPAPRVLHGPVQQFVVSVVRPRSGRRTRRVHFRINPLRVPVEDPHRGNGRGRGTGEIGDEAVHQAADDVGVEPRLHAEPAVGHRHARPRRRAHLQHRGATHAVRDEQARRDVQNVLSGFFLEHGGDVASANGASLALRGAQVNAAGRPGAKSRALSAPEPRRPDSRPPWTRSSAGPRRRRCRA